MGIPADVMPKIPLHVSLSSVGANLCCGEPAPLTLTILNQTSLSLKFSVHLIATEEFMVGGAAHLDTALLEPGSSHCEEYSLIPIKPGEVVLPTVQLRAEGDSAASFEEAMGVSLEEHLNRGLGTRRTAFVQPSGVKHH